MNTSYVISYRQSVDSTSALARPCLAKLFTPGATTRLPRTPEHHDEQEHDDCRDKQERGGDWCELCCRVRTGIRTVPFHAFGGAMVRPMINKRFSTVTVTADHNLNVTLLLYTITPPVQLSYTYVICLFLRAASSRSPTHHGHSFAHVLIHLFLHVLSLVRCQILTQIRTHMFAHLAPHMRPHALL